MPIEVGADVRNVGPREFAGIAYNAMGYIFAVRNEMGQFFNERIYKNEIAARHGDIQLEVPIDVRFDDFMKRYRVDMLVSGCAVFEVKVAEGLSPGHRAQLMNYLMLTKLSRGKLVNLYPE